MDIAEKVAVQSVVTLRNPLELRTTYCWVLVAPKVIHGVAVLEPSITPGAIVETGSQWRPLEN